MQTIIRVLLILVLFAGGSQAAFALDGRDFAGKFAAMFALQGVELRVGSASANDNTIILSHLTVIPVVGGKSIALTGNLIFSGVVETPDGNYTANQAEMPMASVMGDQVILAATSVVFSDISVPGAPTLSTRFFKSVSVGPASVIGDKGPLLRISAINAEATADRDWGVLGNGYDIRDIQVYSGGFDRPMVDMLLAPLGLAHVKG